MGPALQAAEDLDNLGGLQEPNELWVVSSEPQSTMLPLLGSSQRFANLTQAVVGYSVPRVLCKVGTGQALPQGYWWLTDVLKAFFKVVTGRVPV